MIDSCEPQATINTHVTSSFLPGILYSLGGYAGFLNLVEGLLVSNLACKELRGHPSILTISKRLNLLKKISTTFLRLRKEVVIGQ